MGNHWSDDGDLVIEDAFDPFCPYCGGDSRVTGCVEGDCRDGGEEVESDGD